MLNKDATAICGIIFNIQTFEVVFYFWGLHPVASITTIFAGAVNHNSVF
jgi:hypothetical protein